MSGAREGLIKWARAIRERFFATARRDFAGIIVFISKNHNEAAAKKIREAPKTHLISASQKKKIGEIEKKPCNFTAGVISYGLRLQGVFALPDFWYRQKEVNPCEGRHPSQVSAHDYYVRLRQRD